MAHPIDPRSAIRDPRSAMRVRCAARCVAAAALTLALLAGPAFPQAPGGGVIRLEAVPLKLSDSNILAKLRDGSGEAVKDKQDLLIKAARWYVNRLTWIEYQQKPADSTDRLTLNDLVQEAFRYLPDEKRLSGDAAVKARQKKYLQEFGAELVKTIKEVLKNPVMIARINAARILARLGEVGVEESADAMVGILEDTNQIDAVKFYALRGLRELFETVGKIDAERRARSIRALVSFVNRPPPKDASPEEVEAFRYVRREAIRALALSRLPVIVLNKKVVCRPAFELLRVVSKAGIQPEPSIGEQLEAALGLCQMQAKEFPEYQPDFTAAHVGYFVAEFGVEYGKDRNERAKAGGAGQSTLAAEPWKIEAAQLRQALDVLKGEKPDKFMAELVKNSEDLLKLIEANEAVQVANFRGWLGNNRPKNTTLFKGDDKTISVELPQ